MSRTTKEINRITGTIIGISGKLILYALLLLLLVEGVSKGYEFGHGLFYATAMEKAPGTDITLTIPEDASTAEAIRILKKAGLVEDRLSVQIQMLFYEYEICPGTYELNTSMTAKEILQILDEGPEETTEGAS